VPVTGPYAVHPGPLLRRIAFGTMADHQLLDGATVLVGPCDLVQDLTFSSRAAVARLRLADGSTVIAKRLFSTEGLGNETEALRILPAGSRPAFIAAGEGVIVMEDLGDGPSLADVLLGSDAAAAEAALLGWARALGAALRPSLGDRRSEELDDTVAGAGEMRELAQEWGVAVPRSLEDDARTLNALLADPGPWVAYCPGDTCPDNNRVLPGGNVRFFDFEGSGWRHAALEAAYCRAPFCTCWCVARLPDGMAGRMEAELLAELTPPEPERFAAAVGLGAVYYTLLGFDWYRRFLGDDRVVGPPDRGPAKGRQYVYARLRAAAGEGDRIPAIADLSSRLADQIAERWPEAVQLPLYPAFRDDARTRSTTSPGAPPGDPTPG
jgi:hypothetical protein